MTSVSHFYETEVKWTGRQVGELVSQGLPIIEVAPPPEFRGPGGFWTPEHLYVASVNSCFVATFVAIAELSKFEFTNIECSARGKLEKVEGSGFEISQIVLSPRLVLSHAEDRERAIRLLQKAQHNCLISKSIKTEVRMEYEVSSTEDETKAELKKAAG